MLKKASIGIDSIAYVLILIFAALQFVFYLRSPGFINGDATYVELARSITENLPYGYNYKAETRFPPGFPLILALMSLVTGFHFAAMIRAMAIFTGLGFVTSYHLLRKDVGHVCSTLICLLLISSSELFIFVTQSLSPEMPYLFFTFLFLLTARHLEVAKSIWARVALWLVAAFTLLASVALRTAAVALVVALALWLVISYIMERESSFSRLRIFLPLLILGTVLLALWQYWGRIMYVAEWPLQGYPGSYFSEIWLKRGVYPELGNASLGEIFSRLARNLVGYAVGLTAMLSRKEYIVPLWSSPAVIVPLVLASMGVVSKIRRTGGRVQDWYFVTYMAMFLLWPWDYEFRFFLPVAPLACLYLWCGTTELLRLGREKSKALAVASFPCCTVLAGHSAFHAWNMGTQPKLAAVFWLAVSMFSILALCKVSRQSTDGANSEKRIVKGPPLAEGRSLSCARTFALVLISAAVAIGVMMQFQIGRSNIDFDYTRLSDVNAAQYVARHTDQSAVLMAGHTSIVYHYSKRKVIWFPPITNPEILMDGIQKYKVNFIIVIERSQEYYLPPESVCFRALSRAYPRAFHLLYHDPSFDIYEVSADPLRFATHSGGGDGANRAEPSI